MGILSAGLAAQTANARYDNDIQTRVTEQLERNKDFRNLQATTEDGIVTLSGNVDLYQQKLDAAKKIRKLDKVQGVRNEVAVSSSAPDSELRRSWSASCTMTALATTICSTLSTYR